MLRDWLRYLLGKPRTVLVYGYQHKQQFLDTWTDTDFAGCRSERKSTSGGLIMHGSHCLKSWSSTQSIIAGSTGEAEYYGLVKGGSNSLGMRALMEDLGVGGVKLRLKSDASAAIGIASRRGLGKIGHLEVSQLWLQQKVANGDLELIKVNGEDNLADALTKHLGAGDLQRHMVGVGLEEREGRHDIMPEVAQDGEEEYAVQMGPGEDEDGHTLEAIQFVMGEKKVLSHPAPLRENGNIAGSQGLFLSQLSVLVRLVAPPIGDVRYAAQRGQLGKLKPSPIILLRGQPIDFGLKRP